jgi:hypothetical protein
MGTSATPAPGQGSGGNTTGGGAPGGGQGPATGSYVVSTDTRPAASSQHHSDDEPSPRARRAEGARNIADRMVERFGNMEAAITGLAGELFDLRESRRQDAARLAQVPPAGAVVLVGDDVAAWNGYRALGVDPVKAKERLALADQHERAEQARQTGTVAQQAAAALGWGGTDVLGDLVTDKGLAIELRETIVTDAAGKQATVKMPYARKAADTSAPWTPLADYVTQHHKGYLPALTATPQGGTAAPGTGGTPGNTTSTATPAPGTQGAPAPAIVLSGGAPTPGGTDSAPTDPVARMLAANKARAEAPNVLRKAKGT